MDFSLPTTYQELRERILAFAKEELSDDVITRDRDNVFPYELWQRCADFGIQALAAPAEGQVDASNIDILKAVVAMESLGYGCKDNGLALGLNAQMWTVQMVIAVFGTADQKERFLTPLVNGKWLGAHALTEEEAGSDAFNLQMTAEKVDGGYLLNGEKRLVTLAPIADMALVFANAKPALGKWGITAFLVKATNPGFTASENRSKMGLRTVPFGEIKLENCFIPEEDRLGKEGAGFSICSHSLEYDRCGILASHLGAMDRQLEEAIAYAKSRRQFGKSIGDFQSVSNRIADMKVRVETCRLLLYKLSWMKKNGQQALLESSMLKLLMSESFLASSLDAVRIHGGNGYLTAFEVERNLRDAVGGVLYAGTSDIHRNIIAKLVGL